LPIKLSAFRTLVLKFCVRKKLKTKKTKSKMDKYGIKKAPIDTDKKSQGMIFT
jgi:hypothetical protein